MEMSDKILNKAYKDKLVSIKDFRTKYKSGVSHQTIHYAMMNDKIDYLQISPKCRVVVLTEKSLNYQPNESPKRDETMRTVMEV